jgi:chromosome segregation ATPase
VSVDGELLAAANRLQELEQVVRTKDQAIEDGRAVLDDFKRWLEATRERDDVQLAELRAIQTELEAAHYDPAARVAVRDEHATVHQAGDLIAQLQHRTSELQHRVAGMSSSLSSALERAAGLEESAHEATDEEVRLHSEIQALTDRLEHHEEAGAAGDPARSAGIQALLDELRRLLADAVIQAEAAAQERTRLEQQLRLLKGDPESQEADGTSSDLEPQQREPSDGEPPPGKAPHGDPPHGEQPHGDPPQGDRPHWDSAE